MFCLSYVKWAILDYLLDRSLPYFDNKYPFILKSSSIDWFLYKIQRRGSGRAVSKTHPIWFCLILRSIQNIQQHWFLHASWFQFSISLSIHSLTSSSFSQKAFVHDISKHKTQCYQLWEEIEKNCQKCHVQSWQHWC